jgi:hypothetical protein
MDDGRRMNHFNQDAVNWPVLSAEFPKESDRSQTRLPV